MQKDVSGTGPNKIKQRWKESTEILYIITMFERYRNLWNIYQNMARNRRARISCSNLESGDRVIEIETERQMKEAERET